MCNIKAIYHDSNIDCLYHNGTAPQFVFKNSPDLSESDRKLTI